MPAFLRTAEEITADLIVVGRHRRQLLDTFVGTTAEGRIRRSQRPVLMANSMPWRPYGRIVLAIAFDDASRSAITAARRLGLLEQTEPVALHLFDAAALGMKQTMTAPDVVDHYVDSEEQRVSAAFGSYRSTALKTRMSGPQPSLTRRNSNEHKDKKVPMPPIFGPDHSLPLSSCLALPEAAIVPLTL